MESIRRTLAIIAMLSMAISANIIKISCKSIVPDGISFECKTICLI